jgi:hypothetical protein
MKKFFGKKKSNQQFDMGTQIQWKNTQFEPPFDANKLTKYYGLIKVGDKLFHTEYAAKFRSEALAILTEDARIMGGTLDTFGVYK